MSAPANTLYYLTDELAVDVSRITGIPWSYQKVHQRGIHRPFMDLRQLDWVDRLRVAFTLIGGYYYIDAAEHKLAA